jgi:hypothetical protein
MKTNQIHVVAFTMFSHLEQIEHAQETRLSGQRWSNIGNPDQGTESTSISPSPIR